MRVHVNVSLTLERAVASACGSRRAVPYATATKEPLLDRAQNQTPPRSDLLDCYLEGWAEANLDKIVAVTAHDYKFHDPLVGRFSRTSLSVYFECLQARFSRAGTTGASDLKFFISGPMNEPPLQGQQKFFREGPNLGLTGVTLIGVGRQGVIAEAVAYDLNMASEVLRS
jgi:hypothetical protein